MAFFVVFQALLVFVVLVAVARVVVKIVGWVLRGVIGLLLNALGWFVSFLPFGNCLLRWLFVDSTRSDHLRVGSSRFNVTDEGVISDLEGVAASAVTGHIATCRLRHRSRWVRELQAGLGGRMGVVGALKRGWWVPDLPSNELSPVANYVITSVQGGARLLGGGVEEIPEGDKRDGVFFVFESGPDTRDLVFPALLGSLRQYALFRKRDLSLVLGLRSRASEWCRARGFRPWVADVAVCSAVALAMTPSTHEVLTAPRVESAIRAPPLLSESC